MKHSSGSLDCLNHGDPEAHEFEGKAYACVPRRFCGCKIVLGFFFFFAALGLSCSTQDLPSSSQHAGFSVVAREPLVAAYEI